MIRFDPKRNSWQVSVDGTDWWDCTPSDARQNVDAGAVVTFTVEV